MPVHAPHPNAGRHRLHLRVAAKLMLGGAALAVLFVFVSAFLSGDKPGDPTPGMRVDIADLEPGATRTVIWEGRPVLVQHRTAAMIDTLQDDGAAGLRDPRSDKSVQPDAARNAWRSVDAAWFVAIALGTDYGCPVRPAITDPEAALRTGAPIVVFIDECRGSRYDGAGRVLAGGYADRNLVVPEHSIDGDTLVLGR